MKKILFSILGLVAVLGASAQTMNIVVGNVTYQVPIGLAGEMTYADGTSLTVLDKTFNIADISDIYIDGSEVTTNAVAIKYEGTAAKAFVPYNVMALVDVTITDADVVIMQGDAVTEEITYTLSGTTTSGSLYMDGSLKATFVLDGVSITNPKGAAINIRDGKRINVVLNEGTTSNLTDGAGGEQKACFAVKGHAEFSGAGTLNITGNTNHAFWGKEYVEIKNTVGTINVLKAVGDGFNVNQYYKQNGGTINVKNVGDDGIQVSFKTDDNDEIIPLTEEAENTGELLIQGGTLNIATTAVASKGLKSEGVITINEDKAATNITITNSGGVKKETTSGTTEYTASACVKSDVAITIDAGTINLKNTGQGGRAMNCEETITINGGNITASAEGSNLTSSGGGGGGGGWPGGGPGGGSSNLKSAKCIKASGNLTINGGNITASSTNHECIESKADMFINGGVIKATSKDDCLNATGNLTINDGYIYAYSSSNDAVDSNGYMYIKGGVTVAFGGSGAESGIDIDEQHNLQISGGYIFGIGGRVDARIGTCTQAYGSTSSSYNFSGSYIVVTDNNKSPIFAVKNPKSSYSGAVLVSAPTFTKNSTYYVGYTSTASGDETNGFCLSPTTGNITIPSGGGWGGSSECKFTAK